MSSFVLDNSVVMRWLFKDGSQYDRDYASSILDAITTRAGVISVPALWPYEVANAAATGIRKNWVSEDVVSEFLAILAIAPISLAQTGFDVITGTVVYLAGSHRLSAYNAAYLELALRLQVPLATLDKDLRRALAAEGVTLFEGDRAP